MSLLSDAQVADFQENGYVLGPQLLSTAAVNGLCEALEEVLARREDPRVKQPTSIANVARSGTKPIWQVVNIWMATESFRTLAFMPELGEAAGQLLGAEEIRIWHDQIQYKTEGGGGANMWHQDWPYWPILSAPHQVTAWVALDDAAEDNGCMSMVPRSHQWGDQIEILHAMKDFDDLPAACEDHLVERVLAPVPKGAVHFHHGLTWHGSHANLSQRPRRAIAIHFMSEKTCYRVQGNHLCKRLVAGAADGEKLQGASFPLVWSRSGGSCPSSPPSRASQAPEANPSENRTTKHDFRNASGNQHDSGRRRTAAL